MKFFDGTVAEAIHEQKSNGAGAFVIFIEGSDPLSRYYGSVLEDETRIPLEKYVAVRISSRSPEYEKLSQIYRAVPVPSVFVIGESGAPIAVVSSRLDADGIVKEIERAVKKRKRNDSVRILLKLPTGETTAVEFPETSTLGEVRLYVRNSLAVRYPFHMSTPFPRKIFTADDERQTLTCLDLHPTSTILVISAEGQGLRLRAYNLAVSLASELLVTARRMFRQIKRWLTRFLTASLP